MLSHDACICRVEEISYCKRRTIVVILLLLFRHWLFFGFVSRLFHSLSFVIICASWFINSLSVIYIYCFANALYANRSPREPTVRDPAAQTVDVKIRVRAPVFNLELAFIGAALRVQ
jgi:hypothetical protein